MKHVNHVTFLVKKTEMFGQLTAAYADIDIVVVGSAGLELSGETLEETVAAFGRESSTGNREIVNE